MSQEAVQPELGQQQILQTDVDLQEVADVERQARKQAAVRLLRDPSRQVQMVAMAVLRKHPTRAAFAPLRRLLGDPSRELRWGAAHALGAQGRRALGVLRRAAARERDVWVRKAIREAMGKIGGP